MIDYDSRNHSALAAIDYEQYARPERRMGPPDNGRHEASILAAYSNASLRRNTIAGSVLSVKPKEDDDGEASGVQSGPRPDSPQRGGVEQAGRGDTRERVAESVAGGEA